MGVIKIALVACSIVAIILASIFWGVSNDLEAAGGALVSALIFLIIRLVIQIAERSIKKANVTAKTQHNTRSSQPSYNVDQTKPRRMKKPVKIVLILLAVLCGIGIIGNMTDLFRSGPSEPATEAAINNGSHPSPQKQTDYIPYEATLRSGNYIAGIDFPEGSYDIVAISGGGNVVSDNMYSGGINAIMGTKEEDSAVGGGFYEQEYANIRLPDGVALRISGVTVKISSEAASGKPLQGRNQNITQEIELGNGNFVAGQDFPAGTYDIIAVSGGGNISSNNMFSGGLNAIMGTAEEDASVGGGFYCQEFHNAEFGEGVELAIDGVKVKLIPSK